MRLLLFLPLRLLPFAPPILLGWWLASSFSVWLAVMLGVVAAAVVAALGGLLLRSLHVGERSWRNRAVGLLLPWGYGLSRGWPTAILLVSGTVWALLALSTVVNTALWRGGAGETVTLPVLLQLAWIVDGGLLLRLLGNGTSGGAVWAQRRLVAVLTTMLLGSVTLHARGWSWAALAVAGGPPLVVGLLVGGYLGSFALAGKKVRWN